MPERDAHIFPMWTWRTSVDLAHFDETCKKRIEDKYPKGFCGRF